MRERESRGEFCLFVFKVFEMICSYINGNDPVEEKFMMIERKDWLVLCL